VGLSYLPGKTDSHLTCIVKVEEYIKRYNDPSKAIDSQSSNKTQKQLKDNQNVIESLFKVVLLCGKQGIHYMVIGMMALTRTMKNHMVIKVISLNWSIQS